MNNDTLSRGPTEDRLEIRDAAHETWQTSQVSNFRSFWFQLLAFNNHHK
jgi:hypothetical protein